LLALLAILKPLDDEFPAIRDERRRNRPLKRYLLDTNIVSNLVIDPHGRVADRITVIGEANVCTSIIVAAELRYGTNTKASPRLSAQVEAVLGAFDILPLDSPADEIYGSIRTQLHLAGTPIGGNDLLIAARKRRSTTHW
jgi:tRNA(fMet)-specific endonuclease VapC